jgi:hypothetical protein
MLPFGLLLEKSEALSIPALIRSFYGKRKEHIMNPYENINFDKGPDLGRLSNRMNSVLRTIQYCVENKRLFPALTLIYTSIDILGSLQDEFGSASGDNFGDWVKKYFFTIKSFPFTEKDLYGARCGIVHTMRYDSKHATRDGLKEIVYGFRGYDASINKITDHTKQVGVYLEDLFETLLAAYKQYFDDLKCSSDQIVKTNLSRLPSDYVDLIPL